MEKCRKMCEKGVDKRSRNINRTIKKSGITATLSKKEKNGQNVAMKIISIKDEEAFQKE